jgi:undecaprenyl-diphosphatase
MNVARDLVVTAVRRRQPLARHDISLGAATAIAGVGLFTAAAFEARRRRVASHEERVFHHVNDLPDHIHGPVWVVMQSGSLASVGVCATVAVVARRPATAMGLGVAGFATWAGAKIVKHRFRRGRPAAHVASVKVRGREQSGLGFPSGHAAVAVTLASVASPVLPRPLRWLAWATAAFTALARVYVGAHLPLDIVGGIGMGLTAGAATNLALGARGR